VAETTTSPPTPPQQQQDVGCEFDLTHKIAPYLDVHLVFRLLEFLEENTSYDNASVQKARLDLLAPTNMVDYALEMMGEENAPPEMMSRRDSVFEQMELLEQKTTATRAIFEDAEQLEGLRQRGKLNAAGLLETGTIASMLDDY